jgi:hypothetical protein
MQFIIKKNEKLLITLRELKAFILRGADCGKARCLALVVIATGILFEEYTQTKIFKPLANKLSIPRT